MATPRRWATRLASAALGTLALAAATGAPAPTDYRALAALAPAQRAQAARALLAQGPDSAELLLVLGKCLLESGDGAGAWRTLDHPSLKTHPLEEFAWWWRLQASTLPPTLNGFDEALYRSLFDAPGEPSFKTEAAQALADMSTQAKRWADALPPLEALLRADPLDAAVAARLAEACERAGKTDRARELALWLYIEMPARPETLAYFRGSASRALWVQGIPPAGRFRRLLRLDAAGASSALGQEVAGWTPQGPDEAAWRPYFSARLEAAQGRPAAAARALLAIQEPREVARAALSRVAELLPSAGFSQKELQAAARALAEGLPDGPARERAFVPLFRWRLKQGDVAGATYFAARALAPDAAGFAAPEFLYRTAWEHRLSGKFTASDGLLKDLVTGLSPGNEYRQAAHFTRLATGALAPAEADAAREELLRTSRYGYFGYALRGGEPPEPAAAGALPPPPPPAAPGTHRAKAALLSALALDADAAGELARGLGPEPPVWQLWELVAFRQRAGDFPGAVTAARRAFPEAFGERGDQLAPEAWRVLYPLPYPEALAAAATSSGLPADLLAGVARQESLWDREARSKAGAVGLMQLLPSTASEVARRLGMAPATADRLRDPAWNLPAGAAYLRRMLDRSGGSVPLALASYNAGPGNADKWRARPGNPSDERLFTESVPFRETRTYIRRVQLNRQEYRRLYPDRFPTR